MSPHNKFRNVLDFFPPTGGPSFGIEKTPPLPHTPTHFHFKINQCKIDMDKNQSHGRVYRAFEEYTESPCICICWLCICICRLCICIGSIWRSTLRALITLVSFLPPPSSLSIQAIAEWQRQSPFICHGQEPAFSFVMHFKTFSTGTFWMTLKAGRWCCLWPTKTCWEFLADSFPQDW